MNGNENSILAEMLSAQKHITKTVNEIKSTLMGEMGKPEDGLCYKVKLNQNEIMSLKNWRTSFSTRVKTSWIWAWSVIGLIAGTVVSAIALRIIFAGIIAKGAMQ